ncbi:MAG: prolipoprotein diacylglyceryl transferase [Oscillospiraceae bacterium]|jgi:phosphatidylglycerol:prolipoprotein diacylglycerol transferase|nr:prolipoprotein diacylglyceryl transferase [Oscillospiraceae bacterium]
MNEKVEVFFKALDGKSFSVSPVALEFSLLGNVVTIRWYGVLIAFGFLLAVLFGGRIAYKWKMDLDKMVDVLIGGTVGGVVGARLYYVLFNLSEYRGRFWDVFKIWEGGLAIYGGLIGGLLGAFIVCRIRKLNFFNLMDIAAMSFLIGQGIGRWGNFTNQEAFGRNTNLPWGMWSQTTANYINSAATQQFFLEHGVKNVHAGTPQDMAYVHPTFLYESIWCLLSFALLFLICKRARKFSGQLMLCYGILYGAERCFVEGLRLDSLYIGTSALRVSQLLSGLLAVACLAALVFLLLRYKKNPKPIEGVDYFTGKAEQPVVAAPISDAHEVEPEVGDASLYDDDEEGNA